MIKASYEYLLAYKITVPIYDYTVEFCNRCSPYHPNHPDHPNFPNLSSARTQDQMTQAARSGMANIKTISPTPGSTVIRSNPTLPNSPYFPDLPNLPDRAVNLMITLIHQANYLIDKLIKSLEEKHAKEGGFSENLLKKRLEYRRSSQ